MRSLVSFLLGLTCLLAGPADAQNGGKTDIDVGRGRSTPARGQNGEPSVHGGSERVSLGNGRVRLRLLLDGAEPVAVQESGTVALDEVSLGIDWLREELVQRIPGVERVALVQRLRSRSDEHGLAATRERWIEIAGSATAVEAAGRFVSEITAQRTTCLTWELSVFALPRTADGRAVEAGTRIEALDEDAYLARRAHWGAAILESPVAPRVLKSTSGVDLRVRELDSRRYLKDWRLEDLVDGPRLLPETAAVNEGLQGILFGTLLPGGRELALAADLGLGVLMRPVAERVIDVEGERRRVSVPEIEVARFSCNSLRLRENEVGFVVRGLSWPGAETGDGAPAPELVILCGVRAEAPPRDSLAGLVLGVDDALGMVFVEAAFDNECQPGQAVAFSRQGRAVGKGRVLEILGRVMTVRRSEGSVRKGDEVR